MSIKKLIETKSGELENKREFLDVSFEVKSIVEDADDGFFRFEGFAATYGNLDKAMDIVEPGAFTASLLENPSPVILWQHQMSEPIGVIESINDTASGLYIVAKLPKDDTFVSGRVIPQIKIGTIRKMSIGWVTLDALVDANGVRHILQGLLQEISVVTMPANDQAQIMGYKSEDAKQITVEDLAFLDKLEFKDVRDLERALSESKCFSNNAAKKLAGILSRESHDDNEADALAEVKKLHAQFESSAITNQLSNFNKLFGDTTDV